MQLLYVTSARKNSTGHKNSWNQINQFHENSIICNFKNGQKSIFDLGKSLKLSKIQFHEKKLVSRVFLPGLF